MKKHIVSLSVLLFLIAMFTSCDKKENDPGNEDFSTQSVEANKAIIEESGVELINVMKKMESVDAVGVIIQFSELMDEDAPDAWGRFEQNKVITTLDAFAATATGKKSINSLFDAMVSSGELSEDPESIREFWDDNVGTYSWNDYYGGWEIVFGGNSIIMKFPSSDESSSNDAVLTISDYNGVEISNPIDDEYSGDLPTALKANLKVGSKSIVSMTFGASYRDDGVPENIASDMDIEGYKFEADLTNSTEIISLSYKFTDDGEVVMIMSATGKGLFTEENYDDNTNLHSETKTYIVDWIYNPNTGEYEPVYDTYVDEWEETDFEEILNSAEANFQLFNIAIRGEIDVKGLVDKAREIEKNLDDEKIEREEADNQLAEQINKYLNLRMVDVSKNDIIAKVEAYVEKEIDDYYNEVNTWINFRLLFHDDSRIDIETYFEEGFDEFVNELNHFIDDLNYDYDLDIENVDY